MRRIMLLVGVVLGLSAPAGASAQGGSNFSGGGGTSGGGSSFSGGGGFSGGSSLSGGGQSFSGGGMSFSGGGTQFSGGGSTFSGGGQSFTGGTSFTGTQTTTTPGGGARGGAGGSGFTPSTSNFMSKTFSNPLWSGRPGSTNYSPKTLGGFGQATYGATTTGNTTGVGGRTGTANVNRGAGNQSNGFGTVGTPVAPITYTLEVRFPSPPIASPRVQAELQGLINRTSQLRQPANVRVEVDGNVVILRGRVADDDERRLVEAMVRLEPGVHDVQNEIEIPPAPPK